MGLSKLHRLSRKADFLAAYKSGIYWRNGDLRVVAMPSGAVSLFAAVANRKTGCAAERNRYKRRVRTWIRLNIKKLECGSIVIISTTSNATLTMDYDKLAALLNKWLTFYISKSLKIQSSHSQRKTV